MFLEYKKTMTILLQKTYCSKQSHNTCAWQPWLVVFMLAVIRTDFWGEYLCSLSLQEACLSNSLSHWKFSFSLLVVYTALSSVHSSVLSSVHSSEHETHACVTSIPLLQEIFPLPQILCKDELEVRNLKLIDILNSVCLFLKCYMYMYVHCINVMACPIEPLLQTLTPS